MRIIEIVECARAAQRMARTHGGNFRLSDDKLLSLGATLEQINTAKQFLKRYALLDDEMRTVETACRIPATERVPETSEPTVHRR